MKQLFKIVILLFFTVTFLFGNLKDKSAMVYYGKDISYSMVGIHDYIIVQPELIDVYSHGFKIYKEKMYAYVSINEIQESIKEYKYVDKSWVISENREWGSKVLDIKNRDYQEFIFKRLIEPRMKDGFQNFFFDTLDSYQLGTKTEKERETSRKELIHFLKEFHTRYPDAKLILNRGFDVIDEVHEGIEAVLFESYYNGLGGETGYKELSDGDREWLDIYLDKIKAYDINIISLEYLSADEIDTKADKIIEKIKARGMIPYISHRELVIYGKSSKNAIKREILTLVDEMLNDRKELSAHKNGAVILEYMGYIQTLYDINKGLPKIDKIRHYAGIILWLDESYYAPKELLEWIKKVKALDIKILFVNNFSGLENNKYLKKLGIKYKNVKKQSIEILSQSSMIGYEVEPSLSLVNIQLKVKHSIKSLLVYKLENSKESTVSAIMPWGGYAINGSFIVNLKKDNLWVVNPFKFFKETLRLKELIVPDVTTENGRRLLFTHVDGAGIMKRVESDQEYFSGEIILNEILKHYKIPHSVSIIKANLVDNSFDMKLSKKITEIVKNMYKLSNTESLAHSVLLQKEFSQTIINKNDILNINTGKTSITIDKPWLSYIGPLAIKRGNYYHIYTGAQNEIVFTNNWFGPFWGFKRVVQTFKLTNSPRRFKPIDIYYHIYSGSKKASLKALKYIFDWSLKQDVLPIFTSEYIPKVKDFYEISMANEYNLWLIDGMDSLTTLRIEKADASIDFKKSKTTLGIKHFENHTYISLDKSKKHFIKIDKEEEYMPDSYLISSNAQVVKFINNLKSKQIVFKGYVDLEIDLHLQRGCKIYSKPKVDNVNQSRGSIKLFYKGTKNAIINIKCKE